MVHHFTPQIVMSFPALRVLKVVGGTGINTATIETLKESTSEVTMPHLPTVLTGIIGTDIITH